MCFSQVQSNNGTDTRTIHRYKSNKINSSYKTNKYKATLDYLKRKYLRALQNSFTFIICKILAGMLIYRNGELHNEKE